MHSTNIFYDPEGWMLTEDNEVIAVARDSSYKEIVRHGKSMVSLIVAEISEPPIMIVPFYAKKDPMVKQTHGACSSEIKQHKKRMHTPTNSTHRNRMCKIHSRQKKQHPKYIYQRLSSVAEEYEKSFPYSVPSTESISPIPSSMDIVNSSQIHIPEEKEDKEIWEKEQLKEYLQNQMYWDEYFYFDY